MVNTLAASLWYTNILPTSLITVWAMKVSINGDWVAKHLHGRQLKLRFRKQSFIGHWLTLRNRMDAPQKLQQHQFFYNESFSSAFRSEPYSDCETEHSFAICNSRRYVRYTGQANPFLNDLQSNSLIPSAFDISWNHLTHQHLIT